MQIELADVEKVFHYKMIKKIVLIAVLLFCNFSIAQKQFIEKTYNTEYDEGCLEVGINTGKPVFFMVYVNNSQPNDSLIAVREFNELKKNFKEANFYFLSKKGKIKLNNTSKENLNFDEINESYEKVIYWDGKKESELTEYKSIIKSSEYFSKILKVNKTSSYINDYNSQINSFNKQRVWEPDEHSEKLSNKYLKFFLFEQLKVIGDFSEFLNLDFKGVEKLTIKSNLEKIKNPWQEIYFNREGLPTKAIVSKDHSDETKITVNYEYKDNLLSKITVSYKNSGAEESKYYTNFYYSDKKLVVVNDSRIIVYALNSGFLTYKSYYMHETNFDFLIDTYNLNGSNELKYTESGGLNNNTMVFKNKESFLPVIYTIRPEGDEYHKQVSVLKKINDLNYTVTSKDVAYIKIKYSNKNLISEVLLIDPDEISKNKKMNQYKFDFKYDYYK